ncbi:methionine--tRNA ligase, putative [Plasmodium gallinaceum]|uniref:methionine--tRNA ligase n=1 Tax=Plasmodium gallinaceum TaxID=5849 RepID=A0A1J1GP85_PLAGA|nr:methionine--tRNA ligase, putative [Plasmodium gallinaceum]CRG94108.1 methionine--tRNA ligase, putative [Plasmodium gallinaceum]
MKYFLLFILYFKILLIIKIKEKILFCYSLSYKKIKNDSFNNLKEIKLYIYIKRKPKDYLYVKNYTKNEYKQKANNIIQVNLNKLEYLKNDSKNSIKRELNEYKNDVNNDNINNDNINNDNINYDNINNDNINNDNINNDNINNDNINNDIINNEHSNNNEINDILDYLKKSNKNKKCLFMSTPLYYGNDKPHIGHAYCNILGDVINRFEKLLNGNKKNIIFFSGMDEHGLKIELKSKKMNINNNEHIDNICKYYRKMNMNLDVKVNLFYRTSNKFHKSFVQNIWRYLLYNNYIYKDVYKGYYDINEERYLSELELKEKKNKENVIYIEEENSYFFNILKFQEFLINFYETNEDYIFPNYLQKEIIYFLKNDLKNICISRYNTEWGIKIPGEEKGTIYVWFDALLSYISSILYIIKKNNLENEQKKKKKSKTPLNLYTDNLTSNNLKTNDIFCSYEDILNLANINNNKGNNINIHNIVSENNNNNNNNNNFFKLFEKAWNPFIQIIGKDILKFHGILYICLLKSLNLKFPEKILCHGLIKNKNIKMSKSLNNIVCPFTLLEKYNSDVIRIYFLGCSNIYEDKNFKEENLQTFELFLRNNIGNLLYRLLSLCLANNYKIIEEIKLDDYNNSSILNECRDIRKKLIKFIKNMEFPLFLENIMILIKNINKFFVHKRPWNYVNNSYQFNLIIYETLESIKFFSIFMYPIIPQISLTILKNIGLKNINENNISIDMLEKKTENFVLKKLIKII